MLTLNTNIMSLTTQNYLNITGSTMGIAAERLASGKRINSSKDEAASLGIAIADRMATQVNDSGQASRNGNDAISLAQTTEGALKEITNNLQRIRLLTVQAANGIHAVTDRRAIQQEVSQRLEAIDTISQQTQFNGIKVLAKNTSMTFQTGTNDGDVIAVAMKTVNLHTLALEGYDLTKTIAFTDEADPTKINYTDPDGHAATADTFDASLAGRYLIDPLSQIDAALVHVTSLRTILGAVQNRFESNIRSQDTDVANLNAARERIEATDYALETANYTQASILQQAGISVLAQVNAQPKNILPLLQQLG
ncbi:flagellin [Streptomyces subrutilus]|uniref:Flagellin n=1 Tax=Streptomyces subrutilus TaxID=36818 RepID=A0A5P2UEP9_9ACTN|nr:flagellin [Streptomyces subrutilus]QEU76939.1 flagellin FliC [Streptomyces subrutilus]GGZ97298.1 flagellin [Streptomyces subrutilus]